MKKLSIIVMMTLFLTILAGCTTPETDEPTPTIELITYANPVFEPVLADPSIIEHEGTYYVYGTQDYGQWGDEYGVRHIPILSSENLIDWTYAGSAFTLANRPSWGTPNAGLWAPDIVKIGNTFNLYYSLSTWGDPNPGIGVATSSHPLGPWTDRGVVLRSLEIGVNNSIDSHVFEADGKVYMVWGSFRGIYGVELTADGLALKDGTNATNTKILLAGLDTSTSWNGATYEAAYILKKDDYYYMFLSSGSCCDGHNSTYNVRVVRATSPMGPFYDHDSRSSLGTYRGYQVMIGSSFFAGPGHNAITQDANEDYWIVYHAFNRAETATYGNSPRRSLMIDLLIWDENGWPSVQTTMPSNNERLAPVTE